jgi:hypothetical protein
MRDIDLQIGWKVCGGILENYNPSEKGRKKVKRGTTGKKLKRGTSPRERPLPAGIR